VQKKKNKKKQNNEKKTAIRATRNESRSMLKTKDWRLAAFATIEPHLWWCCG